MALPCIDCCARCFTCDYLGKDPSRFLNKVDLGIIALATLAISFIAICRVTMSRPDFIAKHSEQALQSLACKLTKVDNIVRLILCFEIFTYMTWLSYNCCSKACNSAIDFRERD